MKYGAILKPEAAVKAWDEYMELRMAIEEIHRDV